VEEVGHGMIPRVEKGVQVLELVHRSLLFNVSLFLGKIYKWVYISEI
jgi:hypothetical protein